MSLLTLKDFKDHNVDPTSLTDPFDMLLLVADLAAQKYDQEKQASKRRRKKEKKGPKLDMPTLPNQLMPPDMPAEFKNRIEAMGGTQWVMVIQKALYKTDLEKNNSRLSMPLGKIINEGFLRVDEREYLAQQNPIEVQFIEPSHKFKRMILRQWDMPKESGKTSSTYVLRTYWNEVSQENGLMPKDVVQVWSFRVGCQQQLCLALVVVSRASEVMAGGVLMN